MHAQLGADPDPVEAPWGGKRSSSGDIRGSSGGEKGPRAGKGSLRPPPTLAANEGGRSQRGRGGANAGRRGAQTRRRSESSRGRDRAAGKPMAWRRRRPYANTNGVTGYSPQIPHEETSRRRRPERKGRGFAEKAALGGPAPLSESES